MFMEVATKLIEQAEHTIDLENQSFALLDDNHPPFERFFTVLQQKQKDGKRVRIIFRDGREFPNGKAKQQRLLDRLKDFKFDMDNIKVQVGCHTKAIVVDADHPDQAAVLFGSHNLTNTGALHNRDASLLVKDGEVAAYFSRIFAFDWDTLATQQTDELIGGVRIARPGEETPPASAARRWPNFSARAEARPQGCVAAGRAPRCPAVRIPRPTAARVDRTGASGHRPRSAPGGPKNRSLPCNSMRVSLIEFRVATNESWLASADGSIPSALVNTPKRLKKRHRLGRPIVPRSQCSQGHRGARGGRSGPHPACHQVAPGRETRTSTRPPILRLRCSSPVPAGPSVASSRSCFATWSAPPSSRTSWTRRICASS